VGSRAHFPNCNTVTIRKNNQTSIGGEPVETILHGYAGGVTFKFLVVEVGHCVCDLLEHCVDINVCIVNV